MSLVIDLIGHLNCHVIRDMTRDITRIEKESDHED